MSGARSRMLLVSLLLAAFAACARDPQTGSNMNPEVFAREWLESWDSQDVERILTHYTGDAFYEDVPNVDNGWAEPMRGHQMIRESLIETFGEMPDLRFERVSASKTGDRMVVEWVMKGTRYLEFAGEVSIRGVSVIELEGDRIAWVRDYYDMHLLVTQLGIVPPLGEGETAPAEGS